MPGRRQVLRFIAALAVATGVLAGRNAAAQSCDANHTIRWPESNPVWQLCWVAPPNSSGIDGSGLEIHSVYYNGKLVLGRGHIPIVNVKYDPGGCGGADLSYRDWNAEQAFFEANNVIRPGYAEPTVPPRTVCDNPGSTVSVGDATVVEGNTGTTAASFDVTLSAPSSSTVSVTMRPRTARPRPAAITPRPPGS